MEKNLSNIQFFKGEPSNLQLVYEVYNKNLPSYKRRYLDFINYDRALKGSDDFKELRGQDEIYAESSKIAKLSTPCVEVSTEIKEITPAENLNSKQAAISEQNDNSSYPESVIIIKQDIGGRYDYHILDGTSVSPSNTDKQTALSMVKDGRAVMAEDTTDDLKYKLAAFAFEHSPTYYPEFYREGIKKVPMEYLRNLKKISSSLKQLTKK